MYTGAAVGVVDMTQDTGCVMRVNEHSDTHTHTIRSDVDWLLCHITRVHEQARTQEVIDRCTDQITSADVAWLEFHSACTVSIGLSTSEKHNRRFMRIHAVGYEYLSEQVGIQRYVNRSESVCTDGESTVHSQV